MDNVLHPYLYTAACQRLQHVMDYCFCGSTLCPFHKIARAWDERGVGKTTLLTPERRTIAQNVPVVRGVPFTKKIMQISRPYHTPNKYITTIELDDRNDALG